MNNEEYMKKRDLISVSSAHPDVKAEALAKLTEQYIGIQMRAMALINECAADPIKGD